MSKRNRIQDEMWLNYKESLKNPVNSMPATPHFQQSYSDVVGLLEQKILNFIRLNPRLRNNLISRKRFIQNTESSINLNLIEFKDPYRIKFVESDFEDYCLKFMEVLKPLLKEFLKEIRFSGYVFKYRFLLRGMVFEKLQGVRVVEEDLN